MSKLAAMSHAGLVLAVLDGRITRADAIAEMRRRERELRGANARSYVTESAPDDEDEQ